MPTSRWAIGVLQRFPTMLGHLRQANSSFFWILFFHSVFFLYTFATYWHSCDMHFVSRASDLAISHCIRVYHCLDTHVALCLSLRHEIIQMRLSFPSASGVSLEQFASHEKEANTRRHATGGSATNSCARPACSSQSKVFWMRRDSIECSCSRNDRFWDVRNKDRH